MRGTCVRLIGLPVCIYLLAGCGGGGGGGGNNPPAANAAPTIQSQAFSGIEDAAVTGQITASDPGDTFTLSVVTNPAHGVLTNLSNSGQFTYTPAENFNGEDTFEVRVTDSVNQTATASMRVALAAINDAPVAANDVLAVTSTQTLAVLTNDADVEGDALKVEIVGTPMVGAGSVNADGTVALTLPTGFKGFTKFDYRITDAAGAASQGTAQVFVGIAPFSVIYYGVPTGGGPPGLYLNDLFTNRLVHPPLETGTFENLQVSADGSALAYVLRLPLGEAQVWYIDLDQLGVQRPAASLTTSQTVDKVVVSPNGRYVATVVRTTSTVPETVEVFLFDAQSTAPASRISLDPATQRIASEPKFNATSTALYYLGRTNYSGESAVYRADLRLGSVTRATPVLSGSAGVGYITFWISPDESLILHYRSLDALARELWVTPTLQPDVQTLLHEASVTQPFYPSIAPNFDEVAIPQLSGPDEDRLKLARISAAGATVAAGPLELVQNINPYSVSELLRWRSDSGAFLTTSATTAGLNRVYEVVLSDLDHPRVVNAPIGAQESASNGAYSSDGERISYVVDGLYKRELHVTTPASMGTSSTLVSPAGQYLAAHRLDPSGRVAIMTIQSPLLLTNLDAPGHSLTLADQSGISYLEAIVPRRP